MDRQKNSRGIKNRAALPQLRIRVQAGFTDIRDAGTRLSPRSFSYQRTASLAASSAVPATKDAAELRDDLEAVREKMLAFERKKPRRRLIFKAKTSEK